MSKPSVKTLCRAEPCRCERKRAASHVPSTRQIQGLKSKSKPIQTHRGVTSWLDSHYFSLGGFGGSILSIRLIRRFGVCPVFCPIVLRCLSVSRLAIWVCLSLCYPFLVLKGAKCKNRAHFEGTPNNSHTPLSFPNLGAVSSSSSSSSSSKGEKS